jgi:predicted transcriptional regulator
MKIEDLSTHKLAHLLGITQRAVEDLAKRRRAARREKLTHLVEPSVAS